MGSRPTTDLAPIFLKRTIPRNQPFILADLNPLLAQHHLPPPAMVTLINPHPLLVQLRSHTCGSLRLESGTILT